jgi:hypothetical protein
MACIEAKARLFMRRSPLLPIHLPIQLDGLEQRQRLKQQFARRQGHGPKIKAALAALQATGELPGDLRAVELERRINDWLRGAGYGESELPTRWSIKRHARRKGDINYSCDAHRSQYLPRRQPR